mgnify:FL=1
MQKKYAKIQAMKSDKAWSPEKKFDFIIKISTLDDTERGKLLRSEGLHSSDIDDWKKDFCSSIKSQGPGRPRKDPEVLKLRQNEKELKRDLRRKEKALAEMSARVVLLKKSREIWGVNEDDE